MLAVLAFGPDTTPGRPEHDANGLLIAFASFPAARCLSSASVAIRSGMLPRWLDAMSLDRDRMVDVPNRGKLAGSWPSTPASAPRWDATAAQPRPLGR